MADKLQELLKNEKVQNSLEMALEWLGEKGNETVKAMHYGGQGIIFRLESSKYPYTLSIKVPIFDDEESDEDYCKAIKKDWDIQQLGMKKDFGAFPQLVHCDEEGRYIIRQYIEGTVLHQKIKESSPEERVQLFLDATKLTARVFDAFHESKDGCFLLMDYRAKNILIEEPGRKMFLIDCGSSKKEETNVEKGSRYNSVLGKGSRESWAPERLMGMKELMDRRLDFYSYGVMCYHILYGEMPFHNNESDEQKAWENFYNGYRYAENRIRNDERLKIIKGELIEQLLGCLHPDPHKRFCGKLISIK